jgi:hypothetical protein
MDAADTCAGNERIISKMITDILFIILPHNTENAYMDECFYCPVPEL